MPNRDTADRVQWREAHADLVEFIQNFEGRNTFLRSLRASMQTYGSLTPAQTTAALRAMQEYRDRQNVHPAEQDEAFLNLDSPNQPAGANDCLDILNGDYTLNNGSEHLTYRIHTVLRGPLEGNRILKIQQQYGEFKGFAFLTTSGRVKVWRRFADDERRNEQYIVCHPSYC